MGDWNFLVILRADVHSLFPISRIMPIVDSKSIPNIKWYCSDFETVKRQLYFLSSISNVRSTLPSPEHNLPFGITIYDVEGRIAVFSNLAGSGPMYDFLDPGSIRAGKVFPAISVVQKKRSSASSVDAVEWMVFAEYEGSSAVIGACTIGTIGAAPFTFSLLHFPTGCCCTSGNRV